MMFWIKQLGSHEPLFKLDSFGTAIRFALGCTDRALDVNYHRLSAHIHSRKVQVAAKIIESAWNAAPQSHEVRAAAADSLIGDFQAIDVTDELCLESSVIGWCPCLDALYQSLRILRGDPVERSVIEVSASSYHACTQLKITEKLSAAGITSIEGEQLSELEEGWDFCLREIEWQKNLISSALMGSEVRGRWGKC